jgi:hypothetical protein
MTGAYMAKCHLETAKQNNEDTHALALALHVAFRKSAKPSLLGTGTNKPMAAQAVLCEQRDSKPTNTSWSQYPNFHVDLILSALADQFRADLRADIQAEVARILPLLKEAGWSVDPIQREPVAGLNEHRVTFFAKSQTGKCVHSTCSESNLPARLLALLT